MGTDAQELDYAYWCGTLAQVLREVIRNLEAGRADLACEYARQRVSAYDLALAKEHQRIEQVTV